MRSSTRHQLKQDDFRESTVETLDWAVQNRSQLIVGAVIVAVIVAAVAGGWAFVNYRNQQASGQLSAAIDKYDAPIVTPGQPAAPGELTFNSAQERAKAANADFTRIADQYSFTQSGRLARYFAGVTQRDMGNNAAAEKQLSDVANGSDKNVAALAKLALAALYQDSNQTPKAIDLYKQLIDKPTSTVGKSTAQFQLAELYQANNQPQDARKIYEQLQKDAPTGPVGQISAQRLQALGPAQP